MKKKARDWSDAAFYKARISRIAGNLGRGKEEFFHTAFRGSMAMMTP